MKSASVEDSRLSESQLMHGTSRSEVRARDSRCAEEIATSRATFPSMRYATPKRSVNSSRALGSTSPMGGAVPSAPRNSVDSWKRSSSLRSKEISLRWKGSLPHQLNDALFRRQ